MRDTAAILVAGGKGLRFGGRIRKQYLPLLRRPILWWSLSAFEQSASVRDIVLVVPADDVKKLSALQARWKFRKLRGIVAGGATRADSVRQGLDAIPDGSKYVAVHDAVRPLVEPALIENVIRAARAHKAALAACPSKDTVKISGAGDFVTGSPPRETVWLAHTPQVFERNLLIKANRLGRKAAVTDDAQLVEKLGVKVKLVQSPPENMKVTVPSDYVLARQILENRK